MDEETRALERELLEKGIAEQREFLRRPEMLTLEQAPAEPVLLLGSGIEARAPAWQFEPGVREAVRAVVEVFGVDRQWQAHDFLTYPEPLLEGRVPLDLLREGNSAEVLRVAPSVASLEQGAY